LAHHHCDWSAMPPANHLTTFLDRHPWLQSNTFSPTAHHVITTAQHRHFGHLYILRTSWSLKPHPCVRSYSLTIVKFSPLSSPSQKGVTITKIGIAKMGIAKIGC
jgi:hypothetical protein